jgi:hypothetical protein
MFSQWPHILGRKTNCYESFVDFADAEDEPTLLKQDILDVYPHLIVIKSLRRVTGFREYGLGFWLVAIKK